VFFTSIFFVKNLKKPKAEYSYFERCYRVKK